MGCTVYCNPLRCAAQLVNAEASTALMHACMHRAVAAGLFCSHACMLWYSFGDFVKDKVMYIWYTEMWAHHFVCPMWGAQFTATLSVVLHS